MSDVLEIGSKEVKTEEQLKQEKIEEAREKAKEIAEKMVKKQFRTMFLQVYDEIENRGKTLEDVISEVEQKKSRMTRSARDFVLNFEPERIMKWVDDENREREEAMQLRIQKAMSK